MKFPNCKTPKDLLQAMVERAQEIRAFFDTNVRGKPGDMVTNLTEEQRQLLQKLKSKDTDNKRWPK